MPSQQPAASSSGRPADRQTGASARPYDYQKALNSLQTRVRELTALKQENAGLASTVRSMLNILRANTANMVTLLTIYSITTAAVIGAAFAERQKAVRGEGLRSAALNEPGWGEEGLAHRPTPGPALPFSNTPCGPRRRMQRCAKRSTSSCSGNARFWSSPLPSGAARCASCRQSWSEALAPGGWAQSSSACWLCWTEEQHSSSSSGRHRCRFWAAGKGVGPGNSRALPAGATAGPAPVKPNLHATRVQAEAGPAPAGAAAQPMLSEDDIAAMLEEQRRHGLRPGQQLGGRGFMI